MGNLAKSDDGIVRLPDNDQYQHRMAITGSTGNEYIIAQRRANGEWSCGCLGWRRHRHCKHLDAMMPLLKRLASGSQKESTKKLKKG